ncbi:MAG: cryptochrome/photolyase family protein [Gammaproteobacteria bacterium]
MPAYSKSLFIFRRDLRLADNTGLNEALRLSGQVIPCFIFDPEQIKPHPYQSRPGLRFMLQSLCDLELQLQQVGGCLTLFEAAPDQVIEQLFDRHQIEAVFVNRDYTPFSRRRDQNLAQVCARLGISWHVFPDALLNEPEQVVKNDNTPYRVFTAFYKRARQFPVAIPMILADRNFSDVDGDRVSLTSDQAPGELAGGRKQALDILDRLALYRDYEHIRDYPAEDGTSRLSPHLKFGTCSVREAYYGVVERLGSEHPLLRQLYWRDFFTHIAYHFPTVFGHAFLDKFDALPWDNDPVLFQAWCEGRTGFPIVDAGMRELNSTGFMHNRVRMITASFLVKDLHIDWRWGERYFAQHLVDYDPCVNNGNWQWVASTGCDAQPYFRIFNPWAQQRKFDPDCRYITRWIPELKQWPVETIQHWDQQYVGGDYPAPIADHAKEVRIAKGRFKSAS